MLVESDSFNYANLFSSRLRAINLFQPRNVSLSSMLLLHIKFSSKLLNDFTLQLNLFHTEKFKDDLLTRRSNENCSALYDRQLFLVVAAFDKTSGFLALSVFVMMRCYRLSHRVMLMLCFALSIWFVRRHRACVRNRSSRCDSPWINSSDSKRVEWETDRLVNFLSASWMNKKVPPIKGDKQNAISRANARSMSRSRKNCSCSRENTKLQSHSWSFFSLSWQHAKRSSGLWERSLPDIIKPLKWNFPRTRQNRIKPEIT